MFQSETQALGDSTTNIFGRITTQNPSNILGTVDSKTNFPNASLWLMNPAGFVFGPNAILNVAGTFAAITANSMEFEDKSVFPALPDATTDGLLDVSAVVAMEFMGDTPPELAAGSTASITVNGLNAKGSNVILVGRDGKASGSQETVEGLGIRGSLTSPQGQITLASVASAGEVPLTPSDSVSLFEETGSPRLASLGAIEVSANGSVSVSGDGGGRVIIQGGKLMIQQANVRAENTGNETGRGIEVHLSKEVLVSNSIISSATVAEGNAGSMTITAPNITVDEAIIRAGSFAEGQAGDLTVNVDALTVQNGGFLDTRSESQGDGGLLTIQGLQGTGSRASEVTITGPRSNFTEEPSALFANALGKGPDAGDAKGIAVFSDLLMVDNGGRIVSRTHGDGNGGDINLEVGRLEITGVGQIFTGTGTQEDGSFTGFGGPGKGGNLTVTAKESIFISGQSPDGLLKSGLFSNAQFGSGDAGNLTISTPVLEMEGGLIIASSQVGSSGNAGDLHLTSDSIIMTNGAEISTSTDQFGRGGNILIEAEELSLAGEGTSITATTTFSSPLLADLRINLNIFDIFPSDLTAVLSSPAGTRVQLFSGVGENGQHFLETQLNDQGALSFSQAIPPFFGTIRPEETFATLIGEPLNGVWVLEITDNVPFDFGILNGWSLSSGNQQFQAFDVPQFIADFLLPTQSIIPINTDPATTVQAAIPRNDGGSITIDASNVQVQNGASIAASSEGTGDGGNIIISAGQNVSLTGAEITAESFAEGDAGSISITAGNTMAIQNTTITSESFGSGQGGTITLNADGVNTFNLNNSMVTALVNNFDAASGETAEKGLANISITSPIINIEGGAVTTESLGTRNAGAVEINAGNILNLRGNSTVSAAADFAQAGTIFLDAGHLLFIQDSTVTSSVLGGPGTVGGDIFIGSNSNPAFVVFQNSTIATTAVFGDGGMISIDGQVVLADPFTTIDVSSQFGSSGTVTLSSPIQNLSGAIAPLPENIVDVAQLVGQHCAAQQGGNLSSFVQAGRDVVPPGPADYLTSPLFLAQPSSGTLQQGSNWGATTLTAQRLGLMPGGTLRPGYKSLAGKPLGGSQRCHL